LYFVISLLWVGAVIGVTTNLTPGFYIQIFLYPILLYVFGRVVNWVYKCYFEDVILAQEPVLEEDFIGTYGLKTSKGWANSGLLIFQKNGVVESYENGKQVEENKWKIVNKEVHTENIDGTVYIFKINTDRSFTWTAWVNRDNERIEASKDKQYTYTKTE